MSPNLPNQPEILRKAYKSEGMVFTFETNDATAEYNKLLTKKAPIQLGLKDEEWGQRHFILKDPSGVYVDVVQYL
jgi:uncharacterized glyoxalase superfamily protein PhnB